jgi:hypothetical protein
MNESKIIIYYLCQKIKEELHGTDLHPDSLNKAFKLIDKVEVMMLKKEE